MNFDGPKFTVVHRKVPIVDVALENSPSAVCMVYFPLDLAMASSLSAAVIEEVKVL